LGLSGFQIGGDTGAPAAQIGEDQRGLQRRWRFVEITDQTFRWLAEALLG
jgi:hypothetical protein